MITTIVILSYIICSIVAGLKQYHVDMRVDKDFTALTVFAVLFSPAWIIGALIRQFIIRDWD